MSPIDLIDELVRELGASLEPGRYEEFAAAAHAALAEIDCNHLGPGSVYRRLRDLQGRYYDYPSDAHAAHPANHYRPSKIVAAPALEHDDGRKVRYRKLRVVG
jgi:hypothetical protein